MVGPTTVGDIAITDSEEPDSQRKTQKSQATFL